MLSILKSGIRKTLDKLDGSHKYSLLELFISEDEPSIYVSSTCNMDELLTELNSKKPFGSNREFYTTHLVTQVYKDIDLRNIEDVIQTSKYDETNTVFLKNVDLCSLSKKKYKFFLKMIARQLNVNIVLESINGLVVKTKIK